jgi:hypothetical protein
MNLDRLRGLYGPLTKTQFPDAFIGRNSDDGFAILVKDDTGDWDRTGPEYPTKTEALAVLPAVHARYHGTDGVTTATRHADQAYAELALAHTRAVQNRQRLNETLSDAASAKQRLIVGHGSKADTVSPHVIAIAQLLVNALHVEILTADRAEQAASDAARDAFNASKAAV